MAKKRCICEICTCGRHRCPLHPNVTIGRGDQPCLLSEYTTTYRKHPIQLRESCKPPQVAMTGDVPLEDKTTNRVDYIAHHIEKPSFRVPDPYARPAGEHDMLTSYHKDYTEKQGAPALAIKRLGQRQVPGKFEGEPTYTSDYRKWDMAGRPNKYGDTAVWQPPQQPFEGSSTFTRDYQRYNMQRPRSSMRPSQAAKLSDSPFDDKTGYKDSYIKHPLQPKFMKEKDVYKPSGVKFDGLSTFRRDYTGPIAPRTDSFKPDNVAFKSQVPLEDMTTFKNDYRKWPTDRPHFHDPDQYKKPEGEMDMNTTHNLAFKEHPLQHQLAKRPQSANMKPGVFDGTTNYSTDFRPWDLGQRARPTMRPDYQPNTAPFEGMSTQKAHYIQHKLGPNQSFKPKSNAMQSDTPFDDHTMYRLDYTPKKFEICPAAVLDTGRSRYQFVEMDTRGHKQYQPTFETVTPLNEAPTVKIQTLVA